MAVSAVFYPTQNYLSFQFASLINIKRFFFIANAHWFKAKLNNNTF